MTPPKRTSLAETTVRAVPWSTRAVILIAFAIQLMPVSDRPAMASWRVSDKLMQIDGRLAALWAADGVAHGAAEAPASPLVRAVRGERARPPQERASVLRFGEWAGLALLPIPPPRAA